MAGFSYGTQINSDKSIAAGNRPAGGEGVVPTTAYTVYDSDGNEIGYITGLDESENRTADRVRHLNAFDAGETLEQVPKPAEMTLECRGFTIYKDSYKAGVNSLSGGDSLIGRLVSTLSPTRFFKTLEDQRIAFDIRVTDASFNEDGTPVEVQGKYYRMCWITRWAKPRDINQASSVETCSIQVGYPEPWLPTA